jgi:hypothetical protein
LFGVDFGINRWLVPRVPMPAPGAASFEMINGMPLAIALAAVSLALSRFEGHQFTARTGQYLRMTEIFSPEVSKRLSRKFPSGSVYSIANFAACTIS